MSSEFGFVLVDNLKKKHYILDRKLLAVLSDKKKINNLKGSGLLSTDKDVRKYIEYGKFWFDYDLEDALLYHMFCYRYPFLDYEDGTAFVTDIERMGEYEKKSKMPSFFKVYDAKQFKLTIPTQFPKIETSHLLETKVAKSKGNFDKDKLSIFLYSCFGNTTNRNIKNYITRPVPSGGAKHPTETYIIFPKGSVFPEGVYHYNVRDHSLEQLYFGDIWDEFLDSTYNIYKGEYMNKFAFVYTSKVDRAMYRYRDLRSTRALLIDEGHLVQNAKLVSRALGLDYISEYKSREDKLKSILQLIDDSEPIISTQFFYEK